jgi:hypothetical protein
MVSLPLPVHDAAYGDSSRSINGLAPTGSVPTWVENDRVPF